MDLLKIMKMTLVTENKKYSRNSDKKRTKNAKGLTKGQKLSERLQKFHKNYKYIFIILLKININF